MSTYPWRFQADVGFGEVDPDVTVFVGDTITNDTTGAKTVYQDVSSPMVMKLSELPVFLENAMTNGVARES